MHLRSYARARYLTVSIALLAGLVGSGSATFAQQLTYEQCAVGARWEPGYGYDTVIRMYGSLNVQASIQFDAAVCSNLISMGWSPVSKYGEWERRKGGYFRPVCRYDWFDIAQTVNVYSLPGNEAWAWADCQNFWGGYGPSDTTMDY